MSVYDFGMIGLGTMGRNLLLNIADNQFAAIGFDKDPEKRKLLTTQVTKGTKVKTATSLQEMVEKLKVPRKIMLLVPAGPIVDTVINDLLPLLSSNDIIIDGGNSHFTDTRRRIMSLQDKKIHFMGMGVSGGEDGARHGPSIMPGGDETAWKNLKPILQAVAAKVNNEPCVAYMGKNASGHYVKMVHNGIEYAIMQLISEVYDFMKKGLGLSNAKIAAIFKKWNQGQLQSFLIEITADIFTEKDTLTKKDLIDVILDKAGSKGTGKWTSQEAMDLGVAIPTIDAAVAARAISSRKDERVIAAAVYKPTIKTSSAGKDKTIAQLHDALQAAIIIAYAQGLSMLQTASGEREMEIPMKEVVKIWRGGCIIRSVLLESLVGIYDKEPALPNILLSKKIASVIKKKQKALRKSVQQFVDAGIPASAIMSALSYLEMYSAAAMPTNLIQAQRDYFGAHTYQRIDQEGIFHTTWNKETNA